MTRHKHKLTNTDVVKRLFDKSAASYERRRLGATKRQRPSPALLALCANATTVDEYLMIKLDAALECLEPFLRPEDVAAVRATMRERLRTEPAWVNVTEQIREMLREANSTPPRAPDGAQRSKRKP
jgi:hypothetical protein